MTQQSFVTFKRSNLVMRKDNNFWSKSGHFFIAQVGSGQPPLALEINFPPENHNLLYLRFELKNTRVKDRSSPYLLWLRTQKYARIRSGRVGLGQSQSLIKLQDWMYNFRLKTHLIEYKKTFEPLLILSGVMPEILSWCCTKYQLLY